MTRDPSTATATPVADASPTHERRADRTTAWRWVRRVIIVAWITVAVCTVVLGERESSLRDLRTGIASGDVTEVRVLGPDRGTAELEWRDGLLRHHASVRQVPPRDGTATVRAGRVDPAPLVEGPVSDLLLADQPALRIEHTGYAGSYSSPLGWRTPVWIGLTMVGLLLLTLRLIGGGPEPWRATRWAWFWLALLAAPIGIPAFLVLSGPSPFGRPRRPERRLTGGWAFLLAVLLGPSLFTR